MTIPQARTRTSTDLINEALATLGVLSAGQDVDPEDTAFVAQKLDGIFRALAALEIVYITDPENIPSELFNPLADIVAGECAAKFGAKDADYIKLKNNGLGGVQGIDIGFGAGAKQLRAISRGKPTGEPLRVEYF
jgi:hypothetical protein